MDLERRHWDQGEEITERIRRLSIDMCAGLIRVDFVDFLVDFLLKYVDKYLKNLYPGTETTEHDLLYLEENPTTELKEDSGKIPSNFYESYSAFANSFGGTIYLGIEEHKVKPNVIVGVENAAKKMQQLKDALMNKTKVSRCCTKEDEITIIPTSKGDVIEVVVHPAPTKDRPVYINGDLADSFFRNGEGDKRLEGDLLHSMVNDSMDVPFDQQPNRFGIKLEDLDQESLERFKEEVLSKMKVTSSEAISIRKILERIGCYARVEGENELALTNGAILFFGKSVDVHSLCPSFWLDYKEVGEGNRYENRITSKDLDSEGNVYSFYGKVLERLYRQAPKPFALDKDRTAGGKMVYELLREALGNMLSNMDLFSQLGAQVTLEKDSVTFLNAGRIKVGLDQALRGGDSRPRNPCIFACFLALGVVDHGGYGIPKIFELCENLHFIAPLLQEDVERTRLWIGFKSSNNEIIASDRDILNAFNGADQGLSYERLSVKTGLSKETIRRRMLILVEAGYVKTNGKEGRAKRFLLP